MKMLVDLTVDEFKSIVKNIVQECLRESYIKENFTLQPYGYNPKAPERINTVYCDSIDKDIKM